MRDVYEVAEVVANYSAAGMPLETMWTAIEYMDCRNVFSLDPERFPMEKIQALVRTWLARGQRYVLMVNPAVAYQEYQPFNHGVEQDKFLKTGNGSTYKGMVWPGVTPFPDSGFYLSAEYWCFDAFTTLFDAETSVDIDAV